LISKASPLSEALSSFLDSQKARIIKHSVERHRQEQGRRGRGREREREMESMDGSNAVLTSFSRSCLFPPLIFYTQHISALTHKYKKPEGQKTKDEKRKGGEKTKEGRGKEKKKMKKEGQRKSTSLPFPHCCPIQMVLLCLLLSVICLLCRPFF
jgi:hypothetical protein